MRKAAALTLFLLLAVLACTCSSSGPAAAAPPKVPLGDYIPGDAIAYAGWHGRTEDFTSTCLFQLLSRFGLDEWEPDTEVEDSDSSDDSEADFGGLDLFGDTVPGADDLQRQAAAHQLVIDILRLTWKRPMAVALVGVDVRWPAGAAAGQEGGEAEDEPGTDNHPEPADGAGALGDAPAVTSAPDGPPEMLPRLHWLIDLGPDREKFDQWLRAALERAEVLQPQQTERGQTIVGPDGRTLTLGYLGEGIFCLSTEPDVLASLGAGRPEDSLPKSDRFRRHMTELRGDGELGLLFVDMAAYLKHLSAAAEDEGQRNRLVRQYTVTGLDLLDVLAGSVRVVEDGRLATRGHFVLNGPPEKAWKLFGRPPLEDADLAHVPADAYFMSAWRMPGAELLKQIRSAEEHETMLSSIASGIEEQFGLAPEDWLPAVGGAWVFSSSQRQGGLLPGLMLRAHVVDAAALAAAEEKMQQHLAEPFTPQSGGFLSNNPTTSYVPRVMRAGGADVHYLLRKHELLKLTTPAYAVHGGRLYLAAYPQAIATTLEQPAEAALVSDERFRQLRAQVSPDACMLGYNDLGRMARDYYGWAVVLWGMAANASADEKPFEPLPTAPWLAEILGQQISAVSMKGQTVVFEEYGTFPLMGLTTLPGGSPLAVMTVGPPAATSSPALP